MVADTGTESGVLELTQLAPRYNLILLDDDEHTYEYVIELLAALFGHPTEKAYQLALEVDASGRAIVYSGPLEVAEFKQEQVHAYGADWRIPKCVGSMSAVIEAFTE